MTDGVFELTYQSIGGPPWPIVLAAVRLEGFDPAWHVDQLDVWEQARAHGFTSTARRLGFVAGRVAARRALAALDTVSRPEVCAGIVPDCLGAPMVGRTALVPDVSITHNDRLALALAFPRWLMAGVDLESVTAETTRLIRRTMTVAEDAAVVASGVDPAVGCTFVWTAREALSKALRTGLSADLSLFEVGRISGTAGGLRAGYRRLPRFTAHGRLVGSTLVTLCLPAGGRLLVGADLVRPPRPRQQAVAP